MFRMVLLYIYIYMYVCVFKLKLIWFVNLSLYLSPLSLSLYRTNIHVDDTWCQVTIVSYSNLSFLTISNTVSF